MCPEKKRQLVCFKETQGVNLLVSLKDHANFSIWFLCAWQEKRIKNYYQQQEKKEKTRWKSEVGNWKCGLKMRVTKSVLHVL